MEKPFSWRNWKRRRRFTLVGYVIIGTVISIDYSVVIATLFSYLHHVIKLDQSEIYYGIIITAFSISSTLCGALAGRWVDKTRNVKNYLNFICVVQVVGSVIYAIPYSVLFPVVGRLLVGVGDPFHNIVSGELIRIYDEPEGIQALWGIASTYSIGFIVGPAASLIFKNVDFHIGKLHITYFNFVGLFMSALMIVSLIVTNTMVYNCSKEFDLKETMKTRKFKIDDFKEDDGVSEPILNAKGEYKTGENVIDDITTAVKITEKENEKSNDYNANLISNRRRKKERSGKDGTSSTTTNNESNINDNSTNDSSSKIELNKNSEDNERNDNSLNNKNSKTIMNNNNNNNNNSNNNSNNINNSNSNTNNENKINSSNSKMTNNDVIPWLDVLSKVCSNKDTLLIIISTFFFNYALFSSDILIPLVCLVTFKWNISSLTYIFIGYGAAYFLVLVLLSRLCKNSHSVYHCLLLCIVMQVLQYVFLLCISVLERDEYRDVVLMTLFLLSGMFVWTIEEVLLRKLISGMVPSKIQSFTESIRSGFARIGTIVASPTTPLLMSYMSWWSTILIASSIGFLLCFIARKRYLLQPIEMDFEVGKIDHLLVETNDAPKGMSEYD